MRMFIGVLVFLVSAIGGIIALGMLLPATRAGSAEATIAAAPAHIVAIVRDVARQPEWRSQVRTVSVLADGKWIETTADGQAITFSWLQTEGLALSLHFSARGYDGEWRAELTPVSGATRVVVHEKVRLGGAISKLISYALFDPAQFASNYLVELKNRAESAE